MDDFVKGIINERTKIQLIPKEFVIEKLNDKINEVTSVIPELIRSISIKALDDLKSCGSELELVHCIKEWASITKKQEDPEVVFFMNAMGSILIRVGFGDSDVKEK